MIIDKSPITKSELLETLHEKLEFPVWGGKNWDALSDLLTDFHWRKEYKIVIEHKVFPKRLPEDDLRMYLEILSESVQFWKNQAIEKVAIAAAHGFPNHELIVIFPSECKSKINEIIDQIGE